MKHWWDGIRLKLIIRKSWGELSVWRGSQTPLWCVKDSPERSCFQTYSLYYSYLKFHTLYVLQPNTIPERLLACWNAMEYEAMCLYHSGSRWLGMLNVPEGAFSTVSPTHNHRSEVLLHCFALASGAWQLTHRCDPGYPVSSLKCSRPVSPFLPVRVRSTLLAFHTPSITLAVL